MAYSVLSWPAGQAISFPAACATCGAAPVDGYRLRGALIDTRVPLCRTCDAKKTGEMWLWSAGAVVGSGLFVFAMSVFLEAVFPFPEDGIKRARLGALFALVLLAAGVLGLFFAFRRNFALYHRLRSPVFVAGERPGAGGAAGRVDLGFREKRFEETTRAWWAGADGDYRRAPIPTFVPPSLPRRWPSVLGIAWGLATMAVSFVRFREIRQSADRGQPVFLRSLEIPIADAFGASGVLGMYLFLGAVIVSLSIAALRATTQRRKALLAGG